MYSYAERLKAMRDTKIAHTLAKRTQNGYTDLDDMLTRSGLTLSDIREVVFIDYIAPKVAEMVKIIPIKDNQG